MGKTSDYQKRASANWIRRKQHQYYYEIDGIKKYNNDEKLENNVVNPDFDPKFNEKRRASAAKYYAQNREKVLSKLKEKRDYSHSIINVP